MSARALALALALVSPASGLAAPSALEPSAVSGAAAGAKGLQTKSTDAVKQKETPPAVSTKEASARPAGPAKRKGQASLDALRKGCYGGVQGKIEPLVREVRDRQLMDAMRRHEPAEVVRPAKILLQGGDEHPSLLEAYQQALAASDEPGDKEMATACRELLDLLVRSETPNKSKK